MLVSFLIVVGISAALTSLVVESVYGDILRSFLAGTPSQQAWETWKVRARTAEMVGHDLPPEPVARWPRLAEAMVCASCVAFWSALLVTAVYPWPGAQDFSPWSLWLPAWVLARLLLGLVRFFEARVED